MVVPVATPMAAPTGTLMVAPQGVLMVAMANLMVAETAVQAASIDILGDVPMLVPMCVPPILNHSLGLVL